MSEEKRHKKILELKLKESQIEQLKKIIVTGEGKSCLNCKVKEECLNIKKDCCFWEIED